MSETGPKKPSLPDGQIITEGKRPAHVHVMTAQQIAPIMMSCIAFGAWGFALGYYLGAILGCLIGGALSYIILEIFVMRPMRKNSDTKGGK